MTINAELEASRLVARAKHDKEEAKYLRDEGDVAGAVAVLTGTVNEIDASPLASDLEDVLRGIGEPTRPLRDVAAQLADCLGMLGGNYRRLGDLAQARTCFQRGRRYEESPALDVMSSYNLVNAITLPLESGNTAVPVDDLEKAVAALRRQTRGERSRDRWAWADLAQCQLLLGDLSGALQSYRRVGDLGDDDTVKSVVGVLERLGKAMPTLADPIAGAIASLSFSK